MRSFYFCPNVIDPCYAFAKEAVYHYRVSPEMYYKFRLKMNLCPNLFANV